METICRFMLLRRGIETDNTIRVHVERPSLLQNKRKGLAGRPSGSMFLMCVLNATAFVALGFAQGIPPHTSQSPLGQYIDPAELLMGVNVCGFTDSKQQCQKKLDAETLQYFKSTGVYDSILPDGTGHPSPDRGSFSAWKKTLGFAADPLTPAPDEIRLSYFNNGDLQFGRDMHCRIQRTERQTEVIGSYKQLVAATYACYVSNFSNDSPNSGPVFDKNVDPKTSAGLAILGHDPIATVAMEVTEVPVGTVVKQGLAAKPGLTVKVGITPKFGEVKFLAYDKDGNPFGSPALDSEHSKAIPGLCMSCHGGAYVPSFQPGGPAVKGGNFLPFDTLNLILPAENLPDALRPDASDDVFRRLNQFVKSTPIRQTISDLIAGSYAWCGGIGNSRCYIDNLNHPFIPSADCKVGTSDDQSTQTCGWATGRPVTSATNPKTSFPVAVFYTEVVAKYCRTCHVALSDHFNVQNFHQFSTDPIHRLPNSVSLQHHMPFAEVPYSLYWQNAPGGSGEGPRDFFDAFFATGPTPRDQCLATVIPSCVTDCANELSSCLTRGIGAACYSIYHACADPCAANDPRSPGIQKYTQRCPRF